MTTAHETPTRWGITWTHVLLAAVLVLSIGGSATAAKLVTGQQIKNNTVTSKDVKNNNLRVKDFKKSQRKKLRGPAGASAFAKPPSGTVIKGAGLFVEDVPGAGFIARHSSRSPSRPPSR